MGEFALETVFSSDQGGGRKTYQLEIQNELMSLITRKSKNGRIYRDGRNLLNQMVCKQVVEEEDLFIDDEPEPGASHIPKRREAQGRESQGKETDQHSTP